MKITLESTEHKVEFNGAPCRVWEGKTEKGVPCFVYVAGIAVQDGSHQQFAEELEAIRPPRIQTIVKPGPEGQDFR